MRNAATNGVHWALVELQRRRIGNATVWRDHQLAHNFIAKGKGIVFSCAGARLQKQLAAGITSADVQVGDSIALISSVSWPMILREKNDAYEMNGPAAIPNIDNGGVWKNVKPEELREIVLI
ncbi:hypothetical protein BT63DRAFT_453386 [Microthyrium microscopicum]|uniref:Uncharacterized protein n=1 Tax=Microthyrium microscopicum TaxID=703497 RepID=A0A6A6UHH6_9PEZI|nr:hypothetical protein BT63DRAFT_453386 [Microthyrium microscopicum]